MGKTLVISEQANIGTLIDRGRAVEFFFDSEGLSVGDIYSARVENILPSIDAVFVNMGNTDKMGFLHAADIAGSGPLNRKIFPKQKVLVQVVKEPTGNKGPRVSTDITLIGRFFVLTSEHNNTILSRRITNPEERARLKSISTLLKPPNGFGLIVRTEAIGASEDELEEDFRDLFLDRWKSIIDQFEMQRRPGLILRDSKDLLYRVLRDMYHDGVSEVAVDNPKSGLRAEEYLKLWSHRPAKVNVLPPSELLNVYGVLPELKRAVSPRVELPSGGYLLMQPTEAMMVIDVNSGKFTSSNNPSETVLKTNIEAATEIARQLRIRNTGGVIVIDFIDMDNKLDRLNLLEHFERLLENDPAHPQISRLSDLGLVELTRHRQEKSLFEAFGQCCTACSGSGWTFSIFDKFSQSKAQCSSPAESANLISTIENIPNPDLKENSTWDNLSEIPLIAHFPDPNKRLSSPFQEVEGETIDESRTTQPKESSSERQFNRDHKQRDHRRGNSSSSKRHPIEPLGRPSFNRPELKAAVQILPIVNNGSAVALEADLQNSNTVISAEPTEGATAQHAVNIFSNRPAEESGIELMNSPASETAPSQLNAVDATVEVTKPPELPKVALSLREDTEEVLPGIFKFASN